MTLFARIALVIFGLLIPLGIAEAYLRIARPIPSELLLPYPYKSEDLRRIIAGETFISFDATLGWKPTAGTSRRFEGVTYAANRGGFRADREYPSSPPPSTRRIAAYGDSYTYCENVDYPDCWTDQLERALPGTEVLNFGVPAYGPDQAWLRYQAERDRWQSCTVVIGYMVENANRVVNRFRPFYKPTETFVLSKPRYVLDGESIKLLPNPVSDPAQLADPRWVEATLGPNDRWYFPGVFVPNPLDALMSVRVARTAAYRLHREGEIDFRADLARQVEAPYRTQNEGFHVAARVLREFSRDVERHGERPLVVVFGMRSDIEDIAAGRPKEYQSLLDWLTAENVLHVDVTDDLGREARRLSNTRSLIANHYRPGGNEQVARRLVRELPALTAEECAGR